MIDINRVLYALDAQQTEILLIETDKEKQLKYAQRDLNGMLQRDQSSLLQRLPPNSRCGARPTEDQDIFSSTIVPFTQRWQSHQEARDWAKETLRDIPTFAVDGSQITPNNEISWMVGLVQIGWYENQHTLQGQYEKQSDVRLLTPQSFKQREDRPAYIGDVLVNWQRFKGEVAQLIGYMEANADRTPKPLCFYDGSFLLSFVQHLLPSLQQAYVEDMQSLLKTSQKTGIPIVGYIDSSYANDVACMLSKLFNYGPTNLKDTALFETQMDWGDRTHFFQCARDDNVPNEYYQDVYFTFLKTTSDHPPARVEIPKWVYESGEHERVLDLVRAECVVGVGYPYVIETADATAVLTSEDRHRFYKLLQTYANKNKLNFRISRKAISKRQRRS